MVEKRNTYSTSFIINNIWMVHFIPHTATFPLTIWTYNEQWQTMATFIILTCISKLCWVIINRSTDFKLGYMYKRHCFSIFYSLLIFIYYENNIYVYNKIILQNHAKNQLCWSCTVYLLLQTTLLLYEWILHFLGFLLM
jgi:hypothetical protein